jgi:hypothetical protein
MIARKIRARGRGSCTAGQGGALGGTPDAGSNKMNVQVLSNRARTAALVEARGGAHEALGISAFDGRVP